MELLLKLFTQPDCSRCQGARKICQSLCVNMQEFDISTRDGLAEASFHQVVATPSILIIDMDQDELELYGWRADLPTEQEIQAKINKLLGEPKVDTFINNKT